MTSGADPLGLYAALATVAAITTALQASAALAPVTQAGHLEQRHQVAAPGSQDLTDIRAEARRARNGALWLTVPAFVVNAVVLVAWGVVSLFRTVKDWVLVAPWVAVAVVSLALAIVTAHSVIRIHRVYAG